MIRTQQTFQQQISIRIKKKHLMVLSEPPMKLQKKTGIFKKIFKHIKVWGKHLTLNYGYRTLEEFKWNFVTDDGEGTEAEEIKSLRLSAHLNLSLCYLKISDHFEAKTSATEALKLDADNTKAYFRRGQAYHQLGEGELAVKDFQEVLRIEPTNKAAQAQLITCQKQIKEQLTREKKIYANMFDKFAKMDTQVN